MHSRITEKSAARGVFFKVSHLFWLALTVTALYILSVTLTLYGDLPAALWEMAIHRVPEMMEHLLLGVFLLVALSALEEYIHRTL